MANKNAFDRTGEAKWNVRKTPLLFSPSIIPTIRTSLNLQGGPFGFKMIDPPWAFQTYSDEGKGKSAEKHYSTMTLDEIFKLDMREHADPRGCRFMLWATAPMYDHARACFAAWDIEYVTQGVWVKTTKDGKGLAFGTGYVLRNCHEPFLIGKIGKPEICSKSVRSVIMAPRREHSRKPDEAYVMADKLAGPDVAKADIFSREGRPGWVAWGNEVHKFTPEAVAA